MKKALQPHEKQHCEYLHIHNYSQVTFILFEQFFNIYHLGQYTKEYGC
jgi:hypothetical protein